MTAQIPEHLRYRGKTYDMCTEPLWPWLRFGGPAPKFREVHTACWRAYVGRWLVAHDRLYLTGIDAHLESGEPVTLAMLFPGYPERVFAHWYTGEVRCPVGECVEYVHMGYASRYERDLILAFEGGELVGERIAGNAPVREA